MPHHGGANVLLICDGKILLILRDNIPGIAAPGRWAIPGGGREGNEDSRTTAWREIKEELTIELPLEKFEFIGSTRIGISFYVVYLTYIPQIHLHEGQDWAFMSVAELVILEHKYGDSVGGLGGPIKIFAQNPSGLQHLEQLVHRQTALPQTFFLDWDWLTTTQIRERNPAADAVVP